MCRLLRQNIHDQGVLIMCIVIVAVLGGDFFWTIGTEIKMVLVVTFRVLLFYCFLFVCLTLFLPSKLCVLVCFLFFLITSHYGILLFIKLRA